MLEPTLKIYVVDDDPISRRLISRALSKCAVDVTEFTHGLDALEQLKVETPEILIVDWEMPFMDGIELTLRVREIQPDLFIFMLSSRDDRASELFARTMGVSAFLGKRCIRELPDMLGRLVWT